MGNSNSTQQDTSRGIDTNLKIKGHDSKDEKHWFNFNDESKNFKYAFMTFHSDKILKNLQNKEGTIGRLFEIVYLL